MQRVILLERPVEEIHTSILLKGFKLKLKLNHSEYNSCFFCVAFHYFMKISIPKET